MGSERSISKILWIKKSYGIRNRINRMKSYRIGSIVWRVLRIKMGINILMDSMVIVIEIIV